jgi:hypothetical protein
LQNLNFFLELCRLPQLFRGQIRQIHAPFRRNSEKWSNTECRSIFRHLTNHKLWWPAREPLLSHPFSTGVMTMDVT